MKIAIKAAVVSALMVCTMSAFADGASESRAVIQSYFSALQAGDTTLMVGLMGKEEAAESNFITETPGYGSWMEALYRNAVMEITNTEAVGTSFSYDVAFKISEAETISETLVVEPEADSTGNRVYRIVRRFSGY